MFTEQDKQILLDHANTIESGLIRLADTQDLSELCEAIRFAGERIEHRLCLVAAALGKR